MPLVSVEHVFHTRTSHHSAPLAALSDVSFTVRDGEYIALIGANGSGKTTLLQHLNGLLLPRSGEVRVDGLSTADRGSLGAIRRMVGMVFQSPEEQMIGLTVEREAAFGLENQGIPEEEIRERVGRVLERLGLWGKRFSSPHSLSGGEQQRLAIAGAVVSEPRCLVLDEASALLDPVGRRELHSILDSLVADGTAVIYATNIMDDAARAKRLLVMENGRLVLDGKPEDVFSDPVFAAAGLAYPSAWNLASRIRARLPSFPRHILSGEDLARAVTASVSAAAMKPERHDSKTVSVKQAGHTNPDSDNDARVRESIIRIRDLSYSYSRERNSGERAVSGLTIDVKPGECVALTGRTGSGKSTFLLHLNALLPVQEGSAAVMGLDLADSRLDVRKLRSGVGLCFQRPEDQLFEYYLGEDIAFGPMKQGIRGDALKARVRQAIESVELDYETFKYRPVTALSGGEKRRGGIAGVLARDPGILLLDEPAAGLDKAGRDALFRMIGRLKELGRTIIIVSHSLEDISDIADRVYVFSGGKIVLEGSPRDVLTDSEGLASAGLEAPFPVEFSNVLASRLGIETGSSVLTEEDAAGFVLSLLEEVPA